MELSETKIYFFHGMKTKPDPPKKRNTHDELNVHGETS